MAIYILLALFAIVLIIFEDFTKINKKILLSKLLFVIIMSLLFIISAFRQVSVGKDTIMYIQYFNIIKLNTLSFSINNLNSLEIGYILLNKVLSFFTSNEQSITIFNSLLLLITMSIFTKKESKNLLLTVFLFITLGFYQTSFNIVRSCYATFIGYIALNKYDSKKIKGLLLFIIAFLIHKSTLILILIPFLSKQKINKKNIKYYIVIIIILYFSLDKLLPFIGNIIPSEYDYYFLKQKEGIIEKAFLLIVHLGLFIGTSLFIKDKELFIKNNKKYYVFILLETLFYLFSIRYRMFTRVAYIFSMYNIVSIPNIIENIEINSNKTIIKYAVIILCLIQFILRLRINNIGSTIPYKFIYF